MKLLNQAIAGLSVCASAMLSIPATAQASTPLDTFAAYGAALNAGDARAAADIFSIDAIFSQAGTPVLNGRNAIFANFQGLFSVVAFDLTFTILDQSSFGDLAYVWSRSGGSIEVGGSAPLPASFRELFIMERGNDLNYLIDQYYFAEAGSVPAVPEPSTWLMLTAGVALICGLRRKRSLPQ